MEEHLGRSAATALLSAPEPRRLTGGLDPAVAWTFWALAPSLAGPGSALTLGEAFSVAERACPLLACATWRRLAGLAARGLLSGGIEARVRAGARLEGEARACALVDELDAYPERPLEPGELDTLSAVLFDLTP